MHDSVANISSWRRVSPALSGSLGESNIQIVVLSVSMHAGRSRFTGRLLDLPLGIVIVSIMGAMSPVRAMSVVRMGRRRRVAALGALDHNLLVHSLIVVIVDGASDGLGHLVSLDRGIRVPGFGIALNVRLAVDGASTARGHGYWRWRTQPESVGPEAVLIFLSQVWW